MTSSTPTVGIGYATGAGGTVTQVTNKSTGVTLNKVCGTIITSNAALASGSAVSFILTNSTIATTDVVILSISSGATASVYNLSVDAVFAGSCRISIQNFNASSFSEAIVINFSVIKSVTV